jgi:hypothetical protein
MGERKGVKGVLEEGGHLKERDYLRDPCVDGRIILIFWDRNFTFKF